MQLIRGIKPLALAAAAAGALFAQSDSRMAELSAEQEQKAAQLTPEQNNKVERGLLRFTEEDFLDRLRNGIDGFRPRFGGMISGSGFGIGPEYHRGDLLDGRLTFTAGASASFKGYKKFDLQLGAPRLSNGLFFTQFNAVHHDYPSLGYYGSGPDSAKTGRTDFRLEDTAVDATFGMRPVRHLTLGATEGYLFNNVGPGTDSRYASTETVYTPAQAPGIDVQSNFSRTSGFVQYDWRDNPAGPRRGGNYFAQFSDYRDRSFGIGNFRRLDLEAQQYVSVLNQRRVFSVRAKSTLTFRDDNRPLPFYMQPTLGGGEDLRGYRPFRFRDDNLFVMNAEYRWEVFSGLDMALFADAGKVFTHKSDFDLNHLESDAGFGFRFNARNRTFLRMDFGFSHEGFQVWFRFNDVFRRGPVRTSSSMGDF